MTWVSVLVFAVTTLVYVALGQDAFHAVDVDYLIPALARGELRHPSHFLYLPIVQVVWQVVGPFGLETYEAMVLASAVGGGLGAGFVHRAAVIATGSPKMAMLVAILCASAPAAMFFATTVEIHGVFLAFLGLAWWAFAHLLRSGSPRCAITLGAAVGLAATVHSTGHLLLIVMAAWYLADRHHLDSASVRSFLGVLAGLAQVVVFVTLSYLVRGDSEMLAPTDSPLGMLVVRATNELGQQVPLSAIPVTIWNEWLRPYAVLSFLGLLAVWFGRSPRLARAMLAPLGIYLAFTFLFLGGIVERGAYFLPLALPTAVVIVRWLRPAAVVVVAIATFGLGVYDVVEHDVHKGDDEFGIGLGELSMATPVFILTRGNEEIHPVLRRAPTVRYARLSILAGFVVQARQDAAAFAVLFDSFFARLAAGGSALYLSDETLSLIETGGFDVFEDFAKSHLRERYVLEPIHRRGFVGVRVRPRS